MTASAETKAVAWLSLSTGSRSEMLVMAELLPRTVLNIDLFILAAWTNLYFAVLLRRKGVHRPAFLC